MKILEKYYSDPEVPGMIFRVFEPEDYWNEAAPGTKQYQPIYNSYIPIAACISDLNSIKCIETKAAIHKIVQLIECDNLNGCWGTTGKPFIINGKNIPVNMGHVFAGISTKYFPEMSWKYVGGSYLVGGFKPLDLRARTYTGDLGGALLAGIKSSEFKQAIQSDNIDQNYILEILNKYFIAGMFQKYDLDADIDSFSLVRILNSNPSMKLSDSLVYYYTNSYEYSRRFTLFAENELNITFNSSGVANLQYNKLYDINDQIISFAFSLKSQDATDCNVLGVPQPYCQLVFGNGGSDTGFINLYSYNFTEGFASSVICLSQEEQGFKQCQRPN